MGKIKRITILFSILCLFTGLYGQEGHPSYEPLFLPESVFEESDQNQADISYTADEIFKTGLLFSEVKEGSESWNRCIKKFKVIKAYAKSEEMMILTEEERGKELLKFLYRDYLKAYELNQTKIDLALETGVYNCVSSAVLYLAAAKAAGLDVRGQRTTQHAFCSIYVAAQGGKPGQLKKIDVETTNPYGFNPGSKEEIEHESQIKRYYVVPKKYYSNRTEVSDGVFTGLIAGNLTSEYIKTGDYKKALPLGAARWEIVRNEPAKATASVRHEFDILAANYVNLLPDSAAAYSSTLDWYSSFIERWGNNTFLQKNLDTSFVNLMVLCNREGNYELAETSLKKYQPKLSKAQIAKSEEIITDIIVTGATTGLSPEQQIEKVTELLDSEELAAEPRQKRARLHLESFWLEALNAYMNSRDYEAGYAAAGRALDQLPESTKIKNMYNGFYNNAIAIIHNNFARKANAGDYSAALEILEEGLKKFPENKTLKKDLTDLQKIAF